MIVFMLFMRLWQVGGCSVVSLSCEETVRLIRSYGSLLSLTVVTVQKSIDNDSSAASEMRTCTCELSPSVLRL